MPSTGSSPHRWIPIRGWARSFSRGSDLHACTGSVLHSAAGNLVLTAAHCLSPGVPARFVPGFARKATADDLWTVDALYLDPRWLANQDPLADYAIARVSRPGGESVEGLVGSALSLGTAPARSTRVTVVAYPAGVGGLPIGCQAGTGLSDGGYPELPCAGLVDGTSGAPWISGSTVTGVIGGLHGGGCAENLSYSSPFDQHVAELYARARRAARAISHRAPTTTSAKRRNGLARAPCSSRPVRRPCRPPRTSGS